MERFGCLVCKQVWQSSSPRAVLIKTVADTDGACGHGVLFSANRSKLATSGEGKLEDGTPYYWWKDQR